MKKRLFALLLCLSMTLTMLTLPASAAEPKDTIPDKYDVVIDLYGRTSDVNISDSKTYYIYSSVPDKLRSQWVWNKKIQIIPKTFRTAQPHIFLDGVQIEVSPSSKTPAIELHGKASAFLYFIGRDSELRGARGRAAIQKNRSEGELHVLVQTGTRLTCIGGDNAAGIGGSYAMRDISNSLFNIDMYGHGVDIHFGSQSNPSYWNGSIKTNGGYGGAGIGGGRGGKGEKLYFYSGSIDAGGGYLASGIGGGARGSCINIHIYNGDVIAVGGVGGAGIGTGYFPQTSNEAAQYITIAGGTVIARGGENGAGIGGGQYASAKNITITGGNVTVSGCYGAGIGGGRWRYGENITVTDTKLSGYVFLPSVNQAAAVLGYGDSTYDQEKLLRGEGTLSDHVIKIGSYQGKLVKLRPEGFGKSVDDRVGFFYNYTDILIPNENGRIDVTLLTLPYVQHYGWNIGRLEMEMIDDPCGGNHQFGWVSRENCHIWACLSCGARDPADLMSAQNARHSSSAGWNTETHTIVCDVCGTVMSRDHLAPRFTGIQNGQTYYLTDSDVLKFKAEDVPLGTVSGISSVSIDGQEQDVSSTEFELPADGRPHTVTASDNAGNATSATVTVIRQYKVEVVDKAENNIYHSSLVNKGEYLRLTLTIPKDASATLYWLDGTAIPPNEYGSYDIGFVESDIRLELSVTCENDLWASIFCLGFRNFYGYDAPSGEPIYVPVKSNGQYGYHMSLSGDNVPFLIASPKNIDLRALVSNTPYTKDDLDTNTELPWKWCDTSGESTALDHGVIGSSDGTYYLYARAEKDGLRTYTSTPPLIFDRTIPAAKIENAELAADSTHYGALAFTVEDAVPVTVTDNGVVLTAENGVYTVQPDGALHIIVLKDACGNTTSYDVSVMQNTLISVTQPADIALQHGEELTLPAMAAVTTSGMTVTQLPVQWNFDPAKDYDRTAKQAQSFTVTGTLDLSDTDVVVPSGSEALLTVEVRVTVSSAPRYTVTVNDSENGTVSVDNASEAAPDGTPSFFEDELVLLSVSPAEGYVLSALSVSDGFGDVPCAGDGDTYSFTQPASNVTVTAAFTVRPEYTVAFDGNGGTPSDSERTTTNQRLTSLPSAYLGEHLFDGWYTEKTDGDKIDTDYVFSDDTTVYAHWTYVGTGDSGGGTGDSGGNTGGGTDDGTGGNTGGGFVDVPDGSYFEDAVDWSVENGITTGTDASHFSPNGICTRAQAVTFLWRAAGSPAPKSTAMPFADVPADSYFYSAVLWAVENGITTGTSATTFSPAANCTRAQIVTFLWRAAGSPAAEGGSPFADVPADAYYAGAVRWAVKKGITTGTSAATFSPDAHCTRAQIVTFIWRGAK